MATYCGQNIGARKLDRVRRGVKDAIVIMLVYFVLTVLIIYPFADEMMMLFVKSGEQILVGGDDMYVSLCRRHYNEGSLGPNGGRLTPVNTKFLETPHMDSEKE